MGNNEIKVSINKDTTALFYLAYMYNIDVESLFFLYEKYEGDVFFFFYLLAGNSVKFPKASKLKKIMDQSQKMSEVLLNESEFSFKTKIEEKVKVFVREFKKEDSYCIPISLGESKDDKG